MTKLTWAVWKINCVHISDIANTKDAGGSTTTAISKFFDRLSSISTTMPPRLNLLSIRQTVSALHPPSKPTLSACSAGSTTTSRRSISFVTSGISRLRIGKDTPVQEQRRRNSSKQHPEDGVADPAASPEAPLPHVSEEAAQLEKIMHKDGGGDKTATSPELEQGTPVSEVSSSSYIGSRSYSFTILMFHNDKVFIGFHANVP